MANLVIKYLIELETIDSKWVNISDLRRLLSRKTGCDASRFNRMMQAAWADRLVTLQPAENRTGTVEEKVALVAGGFTGCGELFAFVKKLV